MKRKFRSFLTNVPLPFKSLSSIPPVKRMFTYLFGNLPWWEILLLIAGIIAILTLVLALFFTYGDETKYRYSSQIYPVTSEEFITSIAHVSNSPIEKGQDVIILKNGDEFMPALLTAIKNAKQSINFTAYIWEKGEMSDQVLAALIDRAKAGVEVRILLDGFGGHGAPQDKLDQLMQAGGHVEKFRNPQFGKIMRIHRRDHRRAIIIDGQTGFTGGMAVADHWLGNAQDTKHWRDNMFQVSGTMAQSLQSAFAQLWAGTHGEILEGPKFYPALPKRDSQPSAYVSLASSPSSDTQPLPKFFWLSIASAKNKIYLNSPYMVPDKHIREALMERARAGVDVRILLPNGNTDAKPIRFASHSYFEELLKAGVKIYEYRPTMIHSKALVVDDTWSVIGSANMDLRSVALNEENVMGILNPKLAQELGQVFLDDQKNADQIRLEQFSKRGILQRIAEAICVNFIKQY